MGMALPNPDYDGQFNTRRMQAERVLPREYSRVFERPGTIELPRFHFWGLSGRWRALPVALRRLLSATLILTFLGAFAASAHIQSESVKGQLERTRFTASRIQDDLEEAYTFEKSSFFTQSGIVGKVTD